MSKTIIIFVLQQLIDLVIGSAAVARVRAAIGRWAMAVFKQGTPADDANTQRREGVVAEILDWASDPKDPMPSYITESWARLMTEAVLRLVKWEAKA